MGYVALFAFYALMVGLALLVYLSRDEAGKKRQPRAKCISKSRCAAQKQGPLAFVAGQPGRPSGTPARASSRPAEPRQQIAPDAGQQVIGFAERGAGRPGWSSDVEPRLRPAAP